jgi:Ca-activated chloride channel family protein
MNARRITLTTLALTPALSVLAGCSQPQEKARNISTSAASMARTKAPSLDQGASVQQLARATAAASAPAAKPVFAPEATAAAKMPITGKAANAPVDAEERKAAAATSENFEQASQVAKAERRAEADATKYDMSRKPVGVETDPAVARLKKGGSFGASARYKNTDNFLVNSTPLGGRGRLQALRHISTVTPAAPKPHAVYNPNMYVADTYIGGNGERDRLAKLIQAGVLVDGKRVKLEAFTHNYAQTFPIPRHAALSVAADTVQSKIITSGAHTYLQIGLQAMKGELPRRPPLNLALVIDRSGSMGDEHKLEYAKSAAIKLVNSLAPSDTFTLIAFDDSVNVLVPAQRVTNKAHIRNLIAALQPGGGTNIFDGLSRAYEQVHKNLSADGVNRVILLSDGEVTVGVNDPQRFHHLAASQVDQDIETSAVGVGIEFNEDLMLSLARDGKGNYHFLKDGADTQRVFAQELDELTHVVAKAVKVRVQLAPGVGLIRVLGAQTLDKTETALVKKEEKKIDRKVAEELGIGANRQNAPDEPGIKMFIPAFYRGDSHVLMMEIKVPPQTAGFAGLRDMTKTPQGTLGQCKIADVSVKYKDLTNMTNREANASVAVQYAPTKDDMIYSVNRNVKKNLLGFQTGEALTQAAALIDQGRVSEAIQKVDERMTVVGVAAQQWSDHDLEQDGRLLDRYKSVLVQLNTHRQLAGGDFGQYLKRSLTYNGYQMTR